MKFLLAGLLIFGLTACNSSNDSKPAPTTNAGKNTEMKDVTDLSFCQGASPRSIEGSWQHTLESDSFEMTITMQIGRTSTRFTGDCSTGGRSLRATAVTSTSYTDSSFSINKEASDSKEINEPNFQMNCDVDLKPTIATYTFQGACLKMQMNGQELTLVPARF